MSKDKRRCWVCGSSGPLEQRRTVYGAKKWICTGRTCRGD